jgi:hypothetical protein
VLALSGPTACGGTGPHATAPTPKPPSTGRAAPAPPGAALGLTEDNAQLLWNPAAAQGSTVAGFPAARGELTALHPTYIRLLVDWARLQPDPSRPPALEAEVSGCVRELGPCAAYAGIAGELAAIASQQRADPGSFQVVLDILGAPSWAAAPAHGCERPGDEAFARPLLASGLAAYRTLIADLLALGRREDVALRYWSPWNEPNDPRFITPQRASCDAASPAVSPAVYSSLAEAMAQELEAAGPGHELLLGELGGYASGSAHRTSVGDFIAGLPAGVLCLGHIWAVHAYAVQGRAEPPDPVGLLEKALAARGGCAADASIWVTEAGAGDADPGRPRAGLPGEERRACEVLAEQVLGWESNPRVAAVFQFSFRDDPAFPVGLVSSDLSRAYPVYGMWRALARARRAGEQPPPLGRLCP